ncbi:molybdopterin-dependent oxidoreductase alpha subunit [Rhodoblastus acidophilus]|uniref:FdhF/YdeP family oxidoreductase n=1 Tax=Rhodoblastus acidophilus TaxID=1074 RepID=UPI0022244737|nr:FdhF/YdeP family oxidoreductase [Rhodoblastus acidophilus]MCW2286236.1 molybdopterin-dependent oxidoreductase alpha subunit [Rhodoblastus acidophilus]MCW2335184.1 molybdopterin-dependent oxidoreductase alpha subunit [Rhodoblastus acidophilus]
MSQPPSRDHKKTQDDVFPVRPDEPTGGWGSLRGINSIRRRERPPVVPALQTLMNQNKQGGHMCTSCAWGKPAKPHFFEFCENGAKATLWDLTSDRCTPEFFARHTVSELRRWPDFNLEMQGRLTAPLRYDPASDRYLPCSWNRAFAEIGAQLKALEPKSTVFYASGKASLEASYLYALFARAYGHNNLPDSSNMCHETTSVALKKSIGVPVGTCVYSDLDCCDAIFYFGQNPGGNSPRMLHPLQDAVRRGCKIVTFNPLREQGLLKFVNPQDPVQMLTDRPTDLSCLYFQVRPGGDIAALLGVCKHVIAAHDAAIAQGKPPVLDVRFIAQHTHGFEEFLDKARATDWAEIERVSGLSRENLAKAAKVYAEARAVMGIYGMGLTQHVHGSQSVGMLVNLLLLRGNIGRPGAGISPVRGHSNVQGQRTVGIAEKPELVPLDRLAELYDFCPPREKGLNTVEACEAAIRGDLKAFISLGGNFVRAAPDHALVEPAFEKLDLTVFIATKLNHSHTVHGKTSFLLPCLVREEQTRTISKPQVVSIEDTFSHVIASLGTRRPASPTLLPETTIVCGLAKATLPHNPKLLWDAWKNDNASIRDAIERTYPEEFKDFNRRMYQPGGFYRGNAARDRVFKTRSGKAEFTAPTTLSALGLGDAAGRYHLVTLRSNDQFNTTIYGFVDRLRGLEGPRNIVLISPADMRRAKLKEHERVTLVCDVDDGVTREVGDLIVTPYALPDGCVAGYYPELNPLLPLSSHDLESKTPAAKGIPVRIRKANGVFVGGLEQRFGV